MKLLETAGAFLVTGLLATAPVRAAVITQDLTFSFDTSAGNINGVFDTSSIAAFNPSLGDLTSVTATLPIQAAATITPEDSPPPIAATTLVILETPVSATPIPLVLNFTYLSSGTASTVLGLGSTLTGTEAAEFEGTGAFPLPVSVLYTVTIGTPVDFIITTTSLGTVTYNYTPVPEPATLPLLALPVIALAALRRRRQP